MMCKCRAIGQLLGLGLGLLAGLPAHAQEARPVPLTEVVVSAERVEAPLRKTAVSAVALGLDEIERKGLAQLSDLVGNVAGVSVPNGFGNMPQAVGIRGVGVSNPAMSQAVGVYVDDVPLVRGYATAWWDLPDIVRIEVLRGPQGTLYGQNASAGAVKILSRAPDGDRQRWLSLSVGNRGARELHGYGNVRFGDDARSAASLALSRRVNDGFGRNATLSTDVNRLDTTQFRAKLKTALPAGFQATVALDGLLDKSDANTTNFPLNHPDSRPRVTYTSDPAAGAFERTSGGLQLAVERLQADGTGFRAITGYRAYTDDPTRPDWGGLEVQRYSIDQVVRQKALSQEFQWRGRGQLAQRALSWTAGLMAVQDRFDFGRYTRATPPATNVSQYTEARTHLETTDVGAYAQGRLSLGEDSGLTLGLRAYRTRQTGANAYWRTDAARQRTTTVYDAPDLAFSKSGLLPRVVVDHQASEAHYLYASVAEGAKFGGFNRAAESLLSAQAATQPERVRTYELGAKSRWADGRFTSHLAAFYNDYRDYLAALSNTVINGVLVTDAVLTNAGRARTYGIDAELAARLTQQLEWTLTAEWLRSRFVNFANPTGTAATDYTGKELPYAPRLSLGSTLTWRVALAGGGTLTADLSAQYIRHHFADVPNTPLLAVPSQEYLHLGLSYATADGRWTFSARVRNLQDRTYVLLRTRIPPLGVDAAYYDAPRTALLSARRDF